MKVLYQESRNLDNNQDGEQSVSVTAFWGRAEEAVPAFSLRGIELEVCSDNELKHKGCSLVSCSGLTDAETVRKAIALFDQAVAEIKQQKPILNADDWEERAAELNDEDEALTQELADDDLRSFHQAPELR